MTLTRAGSTPSSSRWITSSRTSSCGSLPVALRLVPFALEPRPMRVRWPTLGLMRRMRIRRVARVSGIDHIDSQSFAAQCRSMIREVTMTFDAFIIAKLSRHLSPASLSTASWQVGGWRCCCRTRENARCRGASWCISSRQANLCLPCCYDRLQFSPIFCGNLAVPVGLDGVDQLRASHHVLLERLSLLLGQIVLSAESAK